MNKDSKSLIALNIAVLLFGTAGLFGKLLFFSPLLIVLGRVAFASLALALYILIKNYSARRKDKTFKDSSSALSGHKSREVFTARLMMLLLGVLLAAHWLTFFQAIQISTVAIGLLAFSTFPIFVAVLEPLFFRERFMLRYVFLALIALIGVRILIPRFDMEDSIVQGVLWGSLSGLLFAFLTMTNRKLVTRYSPEVIALYQNFIAFLFLFPLSLNQLHLVYHLKDILLLIALGVVFTALSHTLFIYGLKTIPAKIASIIACLEPVYGIIIAMLILNEIPGPRTVTGGLIIIITVIYASLDMKRNTILSVGE